jgi:hypothetical protein
VKVEVGDTDLSGIERADDVGEVALAVEAHGDAGGRRLQLAEAPQNSLERGGLGSLGGQRLDRRAADLGFQRRRRSLGDDPAVVDDPDAVGKNVRLLEVLRGQEDGHAFGSLQAYDLVPQGAPALRVEARRRLVEEQDPRSVGEREREVEPALHAAGVATDLAVRGQAETDASEELVDSLRTLVARDPVQRKLELDVLTAGQQWVEGGLLKRRADRPSHLGPLLDDVETSDPGAPRRGRQERRQHVDGRRLPGAVRA